MREDGYPYHGETVSIEDATIAPALLPDAGNVGIDTSGDVVIDDAVCLVFYFREAHMVIPVYLPIESAHELGLDIIDTIKSYVEGNTENAAV